MNARQTGHHQLGVTLAVPAGSHAVGTTLREMKLPSDRVTLQVWYPAASTFGAKQAPYRIGFPARSLRHRIIESCVRTSAYLDAPAASHAFPVLLYVPGWGGMRNDNSSLAQSLASWGYVVVALDDQYPDRPLNFSSDDAYRKSVQWANEKVHLQSTVVSNVLDVLTQLANTDAGGLFNGSLDVSRLGIMGYSFGGAVAAQVARSDKRITGAANLDGWLFGDAASHGVAKPFLVLSSASDPSSPQKTRRKAQPEVHNRAILDAFDWTNVVNSLRRYGGYFLAIRGTNHGNFSDAAFMPSIRRSELGTIQRRRAAGIIAAYLHAFFDNYLKDTLTPLLEPLTLHAPSGPRQLFDRAAELQIWPSRSALGHIAARCW